MTPIRICLGLAFIVLGSSPAFASSPPGAAASAASPIAAVQDVNAVFGARARPGCAVYGRCVPLTARLTARLKFIDSYRQKLHRHGGLQPLTRSQNFSSRNTYRVLQRGKNFALVEWSAYYMKVVGHSKRLLPLRLTYVAVQDAHGWRLDDNFCTGKPITSLYSNPNVVACALG